MHTTDPSSQILSYSSGVIPEVIGRDEPVEEITLGSGSNGNKGGASIDQEIEQTIRDARVGKPQRVRSLEQMKATVAPLIRHKVRGRYKGAGNGFELELRVDVDGYRPLNKVSGDFFLLSGATKGYIGSFILNTPTISYTSKKVSINGTANFTWTASNTYIRIAIPRNLIYAQQAPAHLTFHSTPESPATAVYTCEFESAQFRSVLVDEDFEEGVKPLESYNTGMQPSGGSGRNVTVRSAFSEAGILVQTSGVTNIVPSLPDVTWDDSELYSAMLAQFSEKEDLPQSKVWLLTAKSHETPGMMGVVIDQKIKQRQACAIFQDSITGNTLEKQRLQLYSYVHTLGHCFNLVPAWQKLYAFPPVPNRTDSLTWMNYPWNPIFKNEAIFWSNFAFQFDEAELVHLRHAYRDNMIKGSNDFKISEALEDVSTYTKPVEDNSGLVFEIKTKGSFSLGEPVVVELKLTTTDLRGKRVNPLIKPSDQFVQIAIQKPNGQVYQFEPLADHMMMVEPVKLDIEKLPAIYESAYIGYGKDGFYFDQAGSYRIIAVYYALDGSKIVSDVHTLRVKSPLSIEEDEIAQLYLGEEQGQLLALLGSDSDQLKKGNEALDLIVDKFGKHPLSVYARLVKGLNASREFKQINSEKSIVTRARKDREFVPLLKSVITSSTDAMLLDNITLSMVMRRLAKAQKAMGDEKGANETLQNMVSLFEKRVKNKGILEMIKRQANETLTKKQKSKEIVGGI